MKLRSGRIINTRAPYKKRAYRRKAKVTKPIKSYVKRAISRNINNHMTTATGKSNSITTATSTVPTFINLLPTLARGSNNENRIGDYIKVKSGTVRGYVTLKPYAVGTNPLVAPVLVKMWVISSKQYNSNNLNDTNIASNFLYANGAPVGFTGDITDLLTPVAKENWLVHYSKTVKLGVGGATTGYPASNTLAFDNSSYVQPFYFNWGRKFKSKLNYFGSSTACLNRDCYLIFQAVYADGTSSGSGSIAQFHYSNHVEFETA